MDFSEYDWKEILTPINVTTLKQLLHETGYDDRLMTEIITGFSQGFDIGYRGPMERQNQSQNLPFHIGDELILWNKIMKEVELGRYAGPYLEPPFEYFVQSPVGLAPKAENKMRLIFHLSYDFGSEENDRSVNFHTPAELCKVKYNDLDHAILNSLKLLSNSNNEKQSLFYGKTDCSSVFCIVLT